MTMLKDIAKLREWCEETGKYLETSQALLGEISDQSMAQSVLPPLRVLKFYKGNLGDMLSRNEPKKNSIGEEGGMYSVPDNVVSINSGKKRAERWCKQEDGTPGQVRLIELE